MGNVHVSIHTALSEVEIRRYDSSNQQYKHITADKARKQRRIKVKRWTQKNVNHALTRSQSLNERNNYHGDNDDLNVINEDLVVDQNNVIDNEMEIVVDASSNDEDNVNNDIVISKVDMIMVKSLIMKLLYFSVGAHSTKIADFVDISDNFIKHWVVKKDPECSDFTLFYNLEESLDNVLGLKIEDLISNCTKPYVAMFEAFMRAIILYNNTTYLNATLAEKVFKLYALGGILYMIRTTNSTTSLDVLSLESFKESVRRPSSQEPLHSPQKNIEDPFISSSEIWDSWCKPTTTVMTLMRSAIKLSDQQLQVLKEEVIKLITHHIEVYPTKLIDSNKKLFRTWSVNVTSLQTTNDRINYTSNVIMDACYRNLDVFTRDNVITSKKAYRYHNQKRAYDSKADAKEGIRNRISNLLYNYMAKKPKLGPNIIEAETSGIDNTDSSRDATDASCGRNDDVNDDILRDKWSDDEVQILINHVVKNVNSAEKSTNFWTSYKAVHNHVLPNRSADAVTSKVKRLFIKKFVNAMFMLAPDEKQAVLQHLC